MNIPEKAKKVFSGIIFDTYQWEQEMFDGTTSTFEMLRRPNTVQIIATMGDKILLAQEEQPGIAVARAVSMFGGRQEPNESPAASAERELLEETGMHSDDWHLWQTFEPFYKIDWTIYIYIARNCTKISEPHLDSGEKIKVLELNFEEFIENILSDKYWGTNLALHVAKLKLNNQLDELRNLIFPPK